MIIYCIACGDPIEAELPPYGIHVGRKCGCGCSMILTSGINNKVIISRDSGESFFGEIEMANNAVPDLPGEFSFFGYLNEHGIEVPGIEKQKVPSDEAEIEWLIKKFRPLPDSEQIETFERLLSELEKQESFELCRVVLHRLNELKSTNKA